MWVYVGMWLCKFMWVYGGKLVSGDGHVFALAGNRLDSVRTLFPSFQLVTLLLQPGARASCTGPPPKTPKKCTVQRILECMKHVSGGNRSHNEKRPLADDGMNNDAFD